MRRLDIVSTPEGESAVSPQLVGVAKALALLAVIFGMSLYASEVSAAVTGVKHARMTSKKGFVGEALRRKKNLEFDGRTVESLQAGNYDSVTHLAENDERGRKHLYDLPRDFSKRIADEKTEMRYRQ